MLLLFRGATGTAATLGLSFGLTAVATATVTLGISIGLTPPTSVELNVSVTPAITIGLTGNNIPYSTSSASLVHTIGLTGRSGYAVATSFSTALDLSGTVGSFFDGSANLAHTLGLAGAGRAQSGAILGLVLGVSGLPEITGGTVSSAATPGIVLNLIASSEFTEAVLADISIGLNATGTLVSGVNPEARTLEKRARMSLRSFLIG